MSRATGASLLLALAGSLGLAPAARAAEPITAEMFEVNFAIPGPDGTVVREMSELDRDRFINKARCECGQPLRATVRLRDEAIDVDDTTRIQTMIGTNCSIAEANPLGQFRACGTMADSPALAYIAGESADFHPVFLASGIDASLGAGRDVEQPTTVVASNCDSGAFGVGGVWVCVKSNGISGCQTDEFILKSPPPLSFDFQGPTTPTDEFGAVVADSGVQLRWVVGQPGDIYGFRVLCERSDNGQPAPNQSFDPPDPLAEPDGTHYFNARNLCDDQPLLSYKTAAKPDGDGSCGDGVRDPGEACDDGEANDDNGLCHPDCSLGVSADLHALDWAYVCSDHIDRAQRSANIYGLENGVDYNFVLVAYDVAGNPRVNPLVTQATPDSAFDVLPGAPPQAGCGCHSDDASPWSSLALLFGLGLARRRRRVN